MIAKLHYPRGKDCFETFPRSQTYYVRKQAYKSAQLTNTISITDSQLSATIKDSRMLI